MGNIESEQTRKCEALTPSEADALFFPGPGGKSYRANIYCGDCPFIRQCLTEAIELGLEGFYAGTSEQQRKKMVDLHKMRVTPIVTFLPPEPPSRRVYLKVFVSEDTHKWLDEDLEPSLEELQLQVAI